MSQLSKEDDVKSETSEISEVSFLEDSDVESDDLKSINSQDLDTPDVSDGELEEPKSSPKMSGNPDSDSKILENSENVKNLPLYLPPQETCVKKPDSKESEDSESSDFEFSVLGKSNGSIESIDSEDSEEPEEEEEPKFQRKSEKNLGSLISAVEHLNIELGKMKVKILESVNKRNAKKESVELKCQKLKDIMKIQNLELELKKATDQNKALEKELGEAKSEIQILKKSLEDKKEKREPVPVMTFRRPPLFPQEFSSNVSEEKSENHKKSLENRKEKRAPVILKPVVPIFDRGLQKTDVFGIEQQTVPSFTFKRSEKLSEDKKEKRESVMLKSGIPIFGRDAQETVPTFTFKKSGLTTDWSINRRAEGSKENPSETVKSSENSENESGSEAVAEQSLTQLQRELLERVFKKAKYPGVFEREQIAEKIGVSLKSVTEWFSNRRAELKKEKLSKTENSEDKNQKIDYKIVADQLRAQVQANIQMLENRQSAQSGQITLGEVGEWLSREQAKQESGGPSEPLEVLKTSKDDKQELISLMQHQTAILAKEVARLKYPDEVGRERQITMGEIGQYLLAQQQANQRNGRPSEPLDVVDSWDDL
ncbi:unnamed protein product [Caenorhabditis nigoni]